MKTRWFCCSLLMLFASCCAGAPDAFEAIQGGIVVHPVRGRDVVLRIYGESIVRATIPANDGFIEQASLLTVAPPATDVPFSVAQDDTTVTLTIPKLRVDLSKQTGAVTFLDPSGNTLLKEPDAGGRRFQPATVMDEQTFHPRQVFESPSDEAFYGLGQHQNGLMNYKGHRIDLKQYNLVAVVPFLVSNHRYGILWANTSRTIFGDPREYKPLPDTLTLYDVDEKEGGLTAEYLQTRSGDTSRVESDINHESLFDQDTYPEGFKPDRHTRIEWSGSIEPSVSGEHAFRLYASNHIRFWIDDELLVDAWRQDWCPWERIVKIPMEAGKRYSIRIEWVPYKGFISLKHMDPLPSDETDLLSLWSEVGEAIDYYFVHGETMDEIISGYRTLTGRTPMMPSWAMGLWQCRERYKTQEELIDVVREFRRRRIPLDNIVQDWNYWPEDAWGDHDFEAARFPDPEGMIDELHDELNTHIMISVWPKFYVGTDHYKQFAEKGWLYPRNVEKQQRDWIGPGYVSTFYDPYAQGARDLFWKQIDEKLFSKGIDAWWLDATEPDIHSNLPEEEYLLRIGPTAMGTSARYRNSYSLMNAKGVYEGQRQSAPDQRVFILTRSAYAGQQRYAAATWSGDVATTWYDMKTQIAAALNFCLSGIPYWTMDIGGFAVDPRFLGKVTPENLEEWRELQTRWFQFGTFCPLFRVHGQFPFREMYNIAPDDHPAYQAMVAYDKLRYRLMPYIYSLAGRATHNNDTIMRALVMEFGSDPKVLDIADQFMFGPALMVCPVTEFKARERDVYLPDGAGWYELNTGRFHEGGQTIRAAAPYSDIPLFVRSGSIVPFGPDIQYTGEKPDDPIRLMVYTGRDGSFSLYEDEGVNYNYEQGAFSWIPFRYDDKTQTLTIGNREGRFPGMPEKRTFEVIWISPDRERIPSLNEPPDASTVYDGSEIKVTREAKSY